MKGLAAAAVLLGVAGWTLSWAWRWRRSTQIPPELGFSHELATGLGLRAAAEALAARWPGRTPDNVVCLGPVRGNAGRVLFHSGPDNRGRNVNIHRPDYVLHVRKATSGRVFVTLETNRPYSYLRLRRRELAPLVRALRDAYGGLTDL
jgi:hypothetical protein